jgi:hypothetical protein
MRRVGLVLAGLGACLIVFALLIPTWVAPRVIKFPLNEYISVTLTDPSASYFSVAKVAEQTGVNMEAVYTIKGDAAKGSSSTAVWNQFLYVHDLTNNQPVQSTTRTMAFDRRTARLTNCCGANVNGDSSIEQSGYVGIVLPIGTQKQTYPVFDTNLNRPVPFKYSGLDAVGGTEAYRFVGTVAPIQNGTQNVPGSLVGMSQASVTLPQYYQSQVTYWIDPVTGALLNVTQSEKLTLRDPSGTRQVLLLFNANLVATQASVNALVAQDNNELTKRSAVSTLLPLVSGILGLILLVVGVLLARRPREDVQAAAPGLGAEAGDAGGPATSSSLVPGLDDEPREATVESPAVKAEAAQAEAPAAEAKADAAEAKADAAEAPAAEAPAAEAKADAAETPTAETPAAETPEAEAVQADEPTAEIPVPPAAQSPEASPAEASPADADTGAAESDSDGTSRRGRRGAHRR